MRRQYDGRAEMFYHVLGEGFEKGVVASIARGEIGRQVAGGS